MNFYFVLGLSGIGLVIASNLINKLIFKAKSDYDKANSNFEDDQYERWAKKNLN